MSISKIEARSAQGDLLILTLDDSSNGYIVEDVTGLDPVKAIIASSTFAGLNGQRKHGSSRDIRNIVVTVSFDPNYALDQTVRSLRTDMYDVFMPETEVQLRIFMEDGLTVNISGTVESCEAPLFSQEPALVASIICDNPDFVDNAEVELTSFMTNDVGYTDIVLPSGSVETGMLVELRAYTALSEFTIYHVSPAGKTTTMQFAVPLILNDLVTIDTTPGQKRITLKRGTTESSILYALSVQTPDWIQLQRGINQLRVYATPSTGSPAYISYNTRYGGL